MKRRAGLCALFKLNTSLKQLVGKIIWFVSMDISIGIPWVWTKIPGYGSISSPNDLHFSSYSINAQQKKTIAHTQTTVPFFTLHDMWNRSCMHFSLNASSVAFLMLLQCVDPKEIFRRKGASYSCHFQTWILPTKMWMCQQYRKRPKLFSKL